MKSIHAISPELGDPSEKESAYSPSEQEISRLSLFFKVFGDETRLRILFLLKDGPLRVSEIATATEASVSAVSHQLKLLKSMNLVFCKRLGKSFFYALADRHVENIIEIGLEHIKE